MPTLNLKDKNGNGKARASLMLGIDGSPVVLLGDENGKPRAVLGHVDLVGTSEGRVEKRPASSLVLFDKDGKVLWKAP